MGYAPVDRRERKRRHGDRSSRMTPSAGARAGAVDADPAATPR
ncbi:hypothetical protein [Natronococcus jeotgali]|nr:hypothetical protein [Natronococcus jeotgali]